MVVASIDLMGGKAVQLVRGRRRVLEHEDPIGLARRFSRQGDIAVIDLDAALNRGENRELIRRICACPGCRVGGGIRSVKEAKRLISWGAERIIVGTRALNSRRPDHGFLGELARAVGRDRVIMALDFSRGRVVTHGWRQRSGATPDQAARWFEPYAGEFLITAVDREGLLAGPDWETVRRIRSLTDIPVTIAGGVSTLEDIERCSAIGVDAQVGMALYTGRLDLNEAFVRSLNWKNDLIPTVTCNSDGQVLMLAYSNRVSLRKTLSSGMMWYFSRRRRRLWEKGASSGHRQRLIRIRADCDRDTLLATVAQSGPACHLGRYTCFGHRRFSLPWLQEVVRDRMNAPLPQSYTATLTDRTVREKLLEEANELVEARGRRETIWEAADLLYFATVLMEKEGVTHSEVLAELWRRRWETKEEFFKTEEPC